MFSQSQPPSEVSMLIEKFARDVPHVTGVLVATIDGVALASVLDISDIDLIAAMTSTALGLGQRLTSTRRLDPLEAVMIQGKLGLIFVYSVGERWVMMVETSSQASFGLVKYSAQELVKQLLILQNDV